MFKKRSSWLIGMAATAMLLAACGGEETNSSGAKGDSGTVEEPVKITFWDENAGPQRTPIWEELITRFEEEHPTIDVEYVGLPKDSAKSKMDAAIAANDLPDVASVQTSWLPEFAIRDALLPLDEYFEGSELKNVINDGAIAFNKEIVQGNKLYGIPYTQNLDIIWVRPDKFAEKGVKIPETWEEFFAATEALTDKANGQYGYTIRGGAGGSFQLQRLMFAYTGFEEYVSEDGKSTINDPKNVEFVEKYLSLYEKVTPKSDITNGYKEMIAGFDTGVVAMVHHNIGSYGEHSEALQPDQFQAIPLPKTADGRYVAEGGNTIGLSIFKTSENQDAAWEFVEYINSASAQSYWNEVVGQIPTNSEVIKEDWIQQSPHIQVAFNVYNDPNTILYKPPFYLPDYRSILDNLVDSGTQAVMSGESTAQEFLDEWAVAIEESQKKYSETFNK